MVSIYSQNFLACDLYRNEIIILGKTTQQLKKHFYEFETVSIRTFEQINTFFVKIKIKN